MAFAFHSLGYAKHPRDAGVPQDRAEAHAEAARQFIMAELVTRYDLDTLRRELEAKIDALRRDLEAKIDTLSLRLTVRMGVMLAAGVAALAAIIKL
jgi:CBS-domain-containing membrane protein